MNTWHGNKLTISIFGESHGEAVGAVVDGLPHGLALDFDNISRDLNRRKPASAKYTTPRAETDDYKILSGIKDGKTCGTPVCVVFFNKDVDRNSYNTSVMRPSHIDFGAYVKFGGDYDLSGGGHASARLTAPLVFIGSICRQLLKSKNIIVGSHLYRIGSAVDSVFNPVNVSADDLINIDPKFPLIDSSKRNEFERELENAKQENDSIGGCVEVCAVNLPIGVGEPFFNSVESVIAHMMFSVPAVKAIEFGAGVELSKMRGSEANDQFDAVGIKNRMKDVNNNSKITHTNNAGGIVGGITNAMPLIFRVTFKPIPTIGRPQSSIDMNSMEPVIVKAEGRHDVCAAVRGAVIAEAVACICIYDLL